MLFEEVDGLASCVVKGRELLANYFEFLDGWTFFSSGKLGYLKRDSLRAGVTVSDGNWGHLCRD